MAYPRKVSVLAWKGVFSYLLSFTNLEARELGSGLGQCYFPSGGQSKAFGCILAVYKAQGVSQRKPQ